MEAVHRGSPTEDNSVALTCQMLLEGKKSTLLGNIQVIQSQPSWFVLKPTAIINIMIHFCYLIPAPPQILVTNGRVRRYSLSPVSKNL